jgi:3-oxoacyl-[acyl-carrier-protein] synthase-3
MKLTASGIKILGAGSAVSENRVTNVDLRPETADWVENRLGILERRHLGKEEVLIDLIESAAKKAILNSGIKIFDLDAIIIATSTPDMINPSMASLLHGRLGAEMTCASFDIQAVCAGFIYGLANVASLISSNAGQYILLVGADQFSKITNFDDRNCVFFGDAAGAMVISGTEGDSFLSVEINSEGTGWKSFHTLQSPATFDMTASEVAGSATTKLPKSIKSICDYAKIGVKDVSWFVTHQPSKPVLDSLEKELGILPEKLLRNLEFRGNTAGATIPLLFDEMNVIELAKKGDYLCFSAIGAGWVWGSAILKWE